MDILSMAVMGAIQGLASAFSGLRILRRDTDCRRMGLTTVVAFLGGMMWTARYVRGLMVFLCFSRAVLSDGREEYFLWVGGR